MSWRFWFCTLLIFSLFVVIGTKLYILHVDRHAFLQKQSNARTVRHVITPNERGIMMDRKGAPLGVSSVVYDIFVNPQTVNMQNPKWVKALQLMGLNDQRWRKKIQQHRGQFAYLLRQAPAPVAEKIAAFKLRGVYMTPQFTRFYIEGERMAHVLGITGMNAQGQEGLELYYNDWLAGKQGEATRMSDLKGNVIAVLGKVKPVQHGKPIALSIDRRIQYITYKALKEAVIKHAAASGSAVILEAKTGQILAMANYPSFNPNTKIGADAGSRRNRSVTDSFEVGSTLKTFSMAKVLEHGKFDETKKINTYPGYYRIGRNTVRDDHYSGVLSLPDVLKKSSNVAISKLVLSLPEQSFPELLSKLGFGAQTGVEFPGEAAGIMPTPLRWRKFALATLSFGYGMAATTLQLANAYAVIANRGIKRAPSLLKQNDVPVGEVVMNPAVADKILNMLVGVTETGGTAVRARVPGYVVAGKTGTARKAIKGGYAKDKYVAVFAGIAPANQPALIMVVMIDETHGLNYYGGAVAAPVFSKVMRQVLPLLGILPTRV